MGEVKLRQDFLANKFGVTDFVVQIGHSFSRIEVSFQHRGLMGDQTHIYMSDVWRVRW